MLGLAAYLGLFVSALGAATILPLQSEAVLASLLMAKSQPAWALLVVATVGNALGSVANWLIGRYVERFRNHRWFPLSEATLQAAQVRYDRYGRWCLLFSWLPIVGDPLTVVAGMMREPIGRFVVLVALAKSSRYLAIYAVTQGIG